MPRAWDAPPGLPLQGDAELEEEELLQDEDAGAAGLRAALSSARSSSSRGTMDSAEALRARG
jgi:hypothetical protein